MGEYFLNDQYSRNHNKCILDIETTSFQPWSGRLICIGVKDISTEEDHIFYDENEESQLIQFFRHINKKQYDEIIGYNLAFDMRFIFARCLLYKLPTNGFFNKTHTDIMMTLKNVRKSYNFNQPGTLDDWAKALLGKKKLFDNTKVPELYSQGRLKELIEYNQNDLELTFELWKRIKIVL